MTRTISIFATAGIAPQVGLVVSLSTILPVLQCISLLVGIIAGLSMLYFGWSRERRHSRREDLQAAEAKDYLAWHRRQHRTLQALHIDDELDARGFIADVALHDAGHDSTHQLRQDQ